MIRVKDKIAIDKNLIEEIARSLSISQKLAKLIIERGYDSVDKAKKFISPSKQDLLDSYLFKGMKSAVDRIKTAKENGETVVVFGDYDADGISAVTVLCRSLKIFGIDAIGVVPERRDGYGLSEKVIDEVMDEYLPDLIITVDCGISAVKEVEYLYDLGVDVIVTDHHEIPEKTPNCLVLNCKMPNDYPFDGLCGAGVAYKLARAIIGDRADAFLDVVTIATIADSMPLVGENRIIVKEGLKLINSGRCAKILKALCKASGAKDVTSTSIAYTLAPRINAAGRMDNAKIALEAFLSDEEEKMENYATLLNEFNAKRHTECDLLYRKAKSLLVDKSPDNRVIALYSEDWKSGITGIVSARLVEEYSKPVILFTLENGVLHGSARSVAKVNIFKALSAVKDLTEEFGGHAQAAGVQLKLENFEEFERRLNEYLLENCEVSDFIQETEVEEVLEEKFTIEFAEELELLEPCGVANKKPLYAIECERANASPLKYGSAHVSFKTEPIEVIYFNGYHQLQLLNSEITKTVVFEPSISIYMGRKSLKGVLKEISTKATNTANSHYTVFTKQLENINQKGKYTSITLKETEEILKKAKTEIYGTLFIINDLNNLDKIQGTESFIKNVISPDGKGNICIILVGSDGVVPEGYNKIVYLDKPLSVVETDVEVFVNEELDGTNVKNVTSSREVFGKVYLAIKSLPQGFISPTELLSLVDFNVFQITFALNVFIELGLVIPQSGRYKAVSGVKRDLNDSSVYKSIKCKINE